MENHFTSFEISRELFDLGLRKETSNVWLKVYDRLFTGEGNENTPHHWTICGNNRTFRRQDIIPAYMATDLGEILPIKLIGAKYESCNMQVWKVKKGWTISYNSGDNALDIRITQKTLPNTMGRMIIFLIKHQLIKI